jgi:hypothetical protein
VFVQVSDPVEQVACWKIVRLVVDAVRITSTKFLNIDIEELGANICDSGIDDGGLC